ncbi:uncharacterized protein LOC108670886 [Hyalella azteca]|uniref:Uncharacterized protein LOC108670886 n=1 Tax=Hyalella azteca TaxID=294128 RepID=A0A8B7NJN6_HYAAZ|nr:uncharacterized protein LOC108670886 [Hyalella azteca]
MLLTWTLAACLVCSARGLLTPPNAPDLFTELPPYVHEGGVLCNEENGCLTLSNATSVAGDDSLGRYVAVTRVYVTTSGARFVTAAKLYDDSNLTVFETTFPNGIEGCGVGDSSTLCSGYPVFDLTSSENSFRFVTPAGNMLGWGLYSQGSFWENSDRFRWGEHAGIAGFIVGPSYNLLVSPLEHPMGVSSWLEVKNNTAALHYGVQGRADSIPAGYRVSVIAVTGVKETEDPSFVHTVMEWGRYVQQKFGIANRSDDFTTQYLGYWTDNGAYYYYNSDDYSDYQMLLLGLSDYATAQDIPIRYLQLDSWWYYKGLGDGVKNWTARADIFPDGIESLKGTGWPILAHNRYFASDTDYADQNGGQYPFFIDGSTQKAVPLDQSFWDGLFEEALQWGLSTYEQDWLDQEYDGVSVLHTNVTLADDWLHNMAVSARQHGIPVQYCMSLPREALHGASESSVTQIRVSDDYHLAFNQWKIGHTSLFAHALGLKPFKDVFWTSNDNVNNPYVWCQSFNAGSSSYLGHVNVTEQGKPCLYWDTVDYKFRYPGDSLYENFCRNPGQMHDRAFCFTDAFLDVPEDLWQWEYCSIPTCDQDCYVHEGYSYIGNQSMTEHGYSCVDWNGFFGQQGAYCRNPEGTEDRPWCFVNADFSAMDFCDNKCLEAIEYNPALQSAVSTLSAGPVGFGDKMENINRDLVLKSCRPDGKLLQPDKPLTAIDDFFMRDDSQGYIWTTETTIGSEHTFGLIFIAEVGDRQSWTPRQLNLEKSMSKDYLSWTHYPYEENYIEHRADDAITILAFDKFMDFKIIATSPLFDVGLSRYAILGEVDKWGHVTRSRITGIFLDEISFQIEIEGSAGEVVYVYIYAGRTSGYVIRVAKCSFTSTLLRGTIDATTGLCSEHA